MGGSRRNGNITKGNKGKKARRRADPYGDFQEGEDQYGRVYNLSGIDHLEVELTSPNEDGDKIVKCRIPGRFYKKVWFKKHDLVVVGERFSEKIYELKGKVRESDANRVKRMFDSAENDDNDMCVQIGGDENEFEEDHDDVILGIRTRVDNRDKSNGNTNASRTEKSNNQTSTQTRDSNDESDSSIDLDDL